MCGRFAELSGNSVISTRNSEQSRPFKTTVKLKIFTACLLFLLAFPVTCQNTQTNVSPHSTDPINVVVLGDSVLWGEGLKFEHKAWYQVKLWLEKSTGRPVTVRVEAHSGAVNEVGPLTDNRTSTNAEVNLASPTINDQIESVLKVFSDPSKVDFVLLSGCGNDVGVQNLLNASKIEEVDDMTRAKCGAPVENLLRRVAKTFPSAQIIVTGYYLFFSDQTQTISWLRPWRAGFSKCSRVLPK
ncbi:MAG: hypothetical protein C5B55_11300 [Blastocatellia bacterium]|nr:MAG: hypothetical protein C5B55_11300 [Blastocatellia bacterium]